MRIQDMDFKITLIIILCQLTKKKKKGRVAILISDKVDFRINVLGRLHDERINSPGRNKSSNLYVSDSEASN